MSASTWAGRSIGGRYQIETLLGQGGMSAVYRATDPNLRRAVAVKLIHPHLSTDPEFVRRFEQEAAAVAQLRHPNIIQVYDFNHDGEVYYMVLEFVAGETLQARLRALHAAGQRLPLGDAAQIMATVAEAVEYAHRRGLIHRDLKPANVMLDAQGQPILMDFGVAKIVGGQQHTATGAMVGTVAYMSPEQIRGTKVDERADIYSLGIMLYEMTAGRPPFEGDSAMTVMFKQVNDPPPDIGQFNAAVPDELRGVIFKALEKEPAQRFQSAGEMARALRGLKLLETAVTPPAPATAVAPPPVLPATAVKPPEKTVAPPTPATVAAAPPEPTPAAAAPPLSAPPAAETPARSAPPPAAPAQKRGLPIFPLIGLAVVILGGVIVFGFLRNRGQDRAANATASQAALAALATTPAPTQAPATAAPTQPPATATTAPTAVPPTRAPSATPPPATAAPTRTVPPTETVVPIPAGMVLIPPGRFEMGSATGQADERPVHPVSLAGFFLDKFEVTNGRYQRCVDAGQCQPPAQRGSFTRAAYFTAPDFADFPVIQVTWDQAVAFCTFEGKRLPTEAEWEYAARGGTERVFPWGDAFEPARVPATSRDTVAVGTLDNASPFGVLDMSGNVNEWVADWYARAYLAGPAENPLGPDRGARRVYRGGSFDNPDGAFYTTTRRYNQFPGFHDADVGFRCAQSLP